MHICMIAMLAYSDIALNIKVDLFAIKTYHEVVDEIYYNVDHLEPWERGTRKTAGMSKKLLIYFRGAPDIRPFSISGIRPDTG